MSNKKEETPLSQENWNGRLLIVTDIETTGLNPFLNEIVQIAMIGLDSNFNPRRDILPFYINIKPEAPWLWNPEARELNKDLMVKCLESGHDSEKAKDLLQDWLKKLGSHYTKYGNLMKPMLLAHNLVFDQMFIMRWLGAELFHELFDGRGRCSMQTANYLNDRDCMHANKISFPKVSLRYLESCLKINMEAREHRSHDALSDALSCAAVYKELCKRGLLA